MFPSYRRSLGLAVVPRLRFLKKSQQKKQQQQISAQSAGTDSSDVSSSDESESEADQSQHEGGDRLKADTAQRSVGDVDDDDADLFTLKKTQSDVIDGDASDSGEVSGARAHKCALCAATRSQLARNRFSMLMHCRLRANNLQCQVVVVVAGEGSLHDAIEKQSDVKGGTGEEVVTQEHHAQPEAAVRPGR